MAITYYNSITQAFNTSTSGSFAFDVGTGSNRTLAVGWVARYDSTTPAPSLTTLTFNSVSLTVRRSTKYERSSNNWVISEIYTLDNPASGSNSLAWGVDTAGLNLWVNHLLCLAYTGANNGVGGNTGTATGNNADPKVTFTTTTSTGLIIAMLADVQANADPFTPDGSETERFDGGPLVGSYWGGELAATASSQTVDLTATAADHWAFSAIEILAAAAGDLSVTISDTSAYQFTGVRVVS